MQTRKSIFLVSFLFFLSISTFAQEITFPLIFGWKFRKVGTNDEWLMANVPGTIYTDLFKNGKIPDPFIGCNNVNLGWVDETDWEYQLKFKIDEYAFKNRHVDLVFEGLDTYADVYINDKLVLNADNMFRKWVINSEKLLIPGENSIRIVFKSALNQVKQKSKEIPYTLPGGEWAFVRKSPYHFGWDWGPRFITCGIWKPVYLQSWRDITIKDIQVLTDSIYRGDAYLTAEMLISSARFQHIKIKVSEGNHALGSFKDRAGTSTRKISVSFKIKNANLWWSNGLGKPYLYNLNFIVEGESLKQSKVVNYGIRKLLLIQEPDSIGKSFYFKLNGVPVFMKGANVIPRQSFLPSASKQKLKELLVDAANSGVNMLRLWGGGAYEEDRFYELCDSLGILVWQDFMFAGSMYLGDSAFLQNVKEEITQQVLRLRNHPSIALWCGNNEVDEAWHNWGWQQQYNFSEVDSSKIWNDYLKIFNQLIPEVLTKVDPQRPYWPSSPKNGWGRRSSMTEGDSHYWGVWWGFEPFEVYKSKVPRFMSEYGFQGFPDFRTLLTFSTDGKSEPDSAELKCHQKHPVGYQTIDKYLQREGFNPKSLEQEIYLSQVVQSIGYRTAIETHRLAMPRCMGTLYWQLNDCWPVVSWSSIDYFGRWKAVQYTIREAYKSILVSSKLEKGKLITNAVSDYLKQRDGDFKVQVFNLSGEAIKSWQQKLVIKPNCSEQIFSAPYEFSKADSSKTFVFTEFKSTLGETVYAYSLNCKPGNLQLQNPEIKVKVEQSVEGNYLVLTSKYPAFYVQIISSLSDFKLENNYFNMLPNVEYRTKVIKGSVDGIEVKSLFDYIK